MSAESAYLNENSPLPLYHQLARIISDKVDSGRYPQGARIPSEHELAKKYGIGRPTVRMATDLLIRKGLLVRKRGAGTFVQGVRREVDLLTLAGTMASFQKQGIAVYTHIIDTVRLAVVKKYPENPFFNRQAYYFSRLSEVEKDPVLLEEIYLHPVCFRGIDQVNLVDHSLSRVVEEKYFMRPTGGKQNFKIGYPDEKRARLLAVSADTPILKVSRFIHFAKVKNGVYSDLFCKTDRFVFSQTLGGTDDEDPGIL
jgi:GntR family transcriptional regulator